MSGSTDYQKIEEELNEIEDTLSKYLTYLDRVVNEGDIPEDFEEIEKKAKQCMDRFFEDPSLKVKKQIENLDDMLYNMEIIEKRSEISELIKKFLAYL